jgi:hypothetical protein
MISNLERRIARLKKREFGPTDPRTPSLASHPGGSLSIENERLILEHQLTTLRHIELEGQRARESREAFWSDPEHLKEKLDSTIRFIAASRGVPPKKIADSLTIIEGTGETVIHNGGEYNYVNINLSDQPVLIYKEPIIPDRYIQKLRTVASLGIKY